MINNNLLQRFRNIRCFVFDIDGVLTDGSLWVFEDARYIRRMNIRDGYALQLAVKMGYTVIIISGSTGEAAVTRLERLGITHIFMQEKDKLSRLEQLAAGLSLEWPAILYMGDDIPDYPVMQRAGLPCAPADAAPEIRSLAAYISPLNGGRGCVRDVIEKVLKLNGHWPLDSGVASR